MLAWSFVDGWIGLCFLPHLIHALSLGILLNTIPNPSISPMAILGMCSFLGEAIDDECKGRPMRIYRVLISCRSMYI
jgi:hypothetical protein